MNRQSVIAPKPELIETKHTLRLRLALDAWGTVRLPWRRSRTLPAAAAWETLTFDFRSGHSFLRLEDADGVPFETCDLGGLCPAGDPLFDHIDRSPALRAALAAAFAQRWGGPLPYAAAELTAERCAVLCAYRGYDRTFYDAVPVRSGGCAVPHAFRRTARALRRIDGLPAAVAGCGLPQKKSIRRTLFARPALLFYGAELRTVHAAMPDPNCFCALLADDHIFFLLSALRRFPGAADFYVDLGRAVGGPALLRLLREFRCNLGMSALAYAAMDDRGRLRERQSWLGPYEKLSERCMPYHAEDELGYSIPVPQPAAPPVPPLSAAGAFSFERLGSSREFSQVGSALQNCLAELPGFFAGETVLAVRCAGAPVAAVQLHGQRVVQALAARNRPIDPGSPLDRAVRDWAARYGLQLTVPEEPDLIG